VKNLATELGGKTIQQLVTDLGADVVKNLAKDLTGKEIQELLAQHGVDVIKWLGKDLSGNAVKDVLARLTPDALNALKDISGKEVKELLDDFGDDVVNTLAASLKGKGLKELGQLGMFKFEPKKLQPLLDAGQGAAVRGLPSLKGKTRAELEATLTSAGFTPPSVRERGMDIWTHADGSIVRVKLGPEALKGKRTVEHFVKEISKNPGKSGQKDIFAKVADNGALVPAGTNFAEESLKQWFKKKQTGRVPDPTELDALMKVWGDAGHIDIVP
jgi:ribosomal protein L12E/L44/L45/RPP1/RPP2